MNELKCPNIKALGEVDYCKETERPSGRIKICHLVSGDRCDFWQAIQQEWDSEREE